MSLIDKRRFNYKLKNEGKWGKNKIIPSLWFYTAKNNISEVIDYYKKIFGNNLEEGAIIPLGDTLSGNAELCEVTIFGRKYSLMSTETEHHSFNEAFSFSLYCAGQKEIDRFWDYFTRDGEESKCGWCIDRYGLRWQVLPENFGELMNRPNAWQVMMSQKKIVIAEYFEPTSSFS